jgi:hypothetical protein
MRVERTKFFIHSLTKFFMAKAEGDNEGLRGKKGSTIFYKVNGKTYAKSTSEKVSAPPTELQQLSMRKFSQTNNFLQPIKEVVDFGFANMSTGMKFPIDFAFSHTQDYAFDETPTGFVLDPGRVLVSRGSLTGPLAAKAVWKDDITVAFAWENNAGYGNAKSKDRSMVLLYNAADRKKFFVLEGSPRSAEMMELNVTFPDRHKGKLHAFIAFSAYNRKTKKYRVSDSVYLGLL